MDVVRARSALAATRFGDLDWVAETGSTNADLAGAARVGKGPVVLGADHQTAGRGRLGRTWQAPPGASLLCSIRVDVDATHNDPHLITTALALAAAEAVEAVAGVRPGVKWPNDLVASEASGPNDPDDRKLAGILAEAVMVPGRPDVVIAGIGLNVNWPDGLPEDLVETAVSLRQLVGHDVDRTDLLIEMLVRLDHILASLDGPGGAETLRDSVTTRSATIGRRVRVERPDSMQVGHALGLTPGGELIIEVGGARHEISVGDIVHLRPDGQGHGSI